MTREEAREVAEGQVISIEDVENGCCPADREHSPMEQCFFEALIRVYTKSQQEGNDESAD